MHNVVSSFILVLLVNLIFSCAEMEFASLERELRANIDHAVELAEQQNALTITLESKVGRSGLR